MKNYTLFPWPLIILVLLMLIGLHAMADEFSATLTASSNNNVTANVLTFKTLNGSSNNFDVNDEPIPSPFTPIIPLFSYFPSTGNDSIFFVKTDARPDADTLSWPFKLRADNLGGQLTWNVSTIPQDRKVILTLPDQTKINLKSENSVNYVAVNGNFQTYTITVTKDKQPTNLSPTIETVNEDSSNNSITLSATDPEGRTVTYSITIAPSNGNASIDSNTITYTPNPDFSSTDTLTFGASDGTSTTTQQLAITVNGVNDAPVATAQSVILDEDSSGQAFTLTGTDVENDSLSYIQASDPSHGQLSGVMPNLTVGGNA